LLSGICLGAAVMFTQKVLFAIPGIAAALAIHLYKGRGTNCGGPPWRTVSWFSLGFLLPILSTLGYFASRSALAIFIEYNFLFSMHWTLRLSPWPLFKELSLQNPFVVGLGVVGMAKAARSFLRDRTLLGGDSVCSLTAFSLLVGAFIIPVPHRQYAMTFLPLIAVLSAGAFIDVVGLMTARSSRPIVMALLLVALSVRPFYQSMAFWERRNWGTLQRIDWILQNVSPEETVLDGFSGEGVFRHHAFFYFFLHNEIRPMLDEREWQALLTKLQNGDIAPKVVLYDRHLKALPREVRDFIETNFLSTGSEPIRARFVPLGWDDTAPRPLAANFTAQNPPIVPYVLIEEGWHHPEMEGGIPFRRSRSKRSHLGVPVMHPDEMNAVFYAKLELEDEPVVMQLAVNGTHVGEQVLELSSGWREYVFSVPRELLKRGFNDFLLSYSKTPYLIDPEHRGRNTVVAVHSLTLKPAKQVEE
jgi:hypothetical protein